MARHRWWLLGLCAVFLLAELPFITAPFSGDGMTYMAPGVEALQRGDLSAVVPAYRAHPPLVPAAVALLGLPFGNVAWLAHLFCAIAAVAGLILTARIAERLTGAGAPALAAAAILAATPLYFVQGHLFRSTVVVMVLHLWTLDAVARGRTRQAMFAAGLSALCHETGVLVLPAAALACFVRDGSDVAPGRRFVRAALWALPALPIAAWLAYARMAQPWGDTLEFHVGQLGAWDKALRLLATHGWQLLRDGGVLLLLPAGIGAWAVRRRSAGIAGPRAPRIAAGGFVLACAAVAAALCAVRPLLAGGDRAAELPALSEVFFGCLLLGWFALLAFGVASWSRQPAEGGGPGAEALGLLAYAVTLTLFFAAYPYAFPRWLLPALPPLVILTVALFWTGTAGRFRRACIPVLALLALVQLWGHTAVSRAACDLRYYERTVAEARLARLLDRVAGDLAARVPRATVLTLVPEAFAFRFGASSASEFEVVVAPALSEWSTGEFVQAARALGIDSRVRARVRVDPAQIDFVVRGPGPAGECPPVPRGTRDFVERIRPAGQRVLSYEQRPWRVLVDSVSPRALGSTVGEAVAGSEG